MTTTDPARQLAKEIATLRREVSGLSRGSQAKFRSLENGYLPVFDENGSLRGQIGLLPDGTTGFVTVNGPPPPMPSAPILEPAVGGLYVGWDGTFFNGAARPGDFSHIEIHASPYSVYTPDQSTHRLSMRDSGSVFIILPPDPYTLVFVAVSTSGTKSLAGIAATETPERAPSYTEVVAANGKNKVFWRKDDNAPTLLDDALIEGDLWFKVDHDNAPHHYDADLDEWVEATLGDDAIAGLNVGKLVAGEIAAGQKIIAGPQFGTHAEMADDGFRVFRQDPTDGLTDEVIRLGTSTDDYFAVVDRNGDLVATIDVNGSGQFTDLNVVNDPVFQGKSLTQTIQEQAATSVGYWEGYVPQSAGTGGHYGPIRARVGISEVNAVLIAGRRYEIQWQLAWLANQAGQECRFIMTSTGPTAAGSDTAPDPLTTSPIVNQWLYTSEVAARWTTAQGVTSFVPTTSGRHRFLLNAEQGAGPTDNIYIVGQAPHKVYMSISDTGQARSATGSLSQGGGTLYQGPPPPPPPPPTQQYYVDLGPSGRRAWSGSGGVIGNGTDVYQGYESYNGNTRGQFWFDLPSITGTVDRVDVYLYYRHWWFNSGGRILMTFTDQRGAFTDHGFWGLWEPNVTVPKPGSATVTLPGGWFPQFRGTNNNSGNGRATALRIGPGPGTNQTYYGVATDARLRIWYTQ